MLSKRQYSIVEILLSDKQFHTAKQLSAKLGVSERTVKSDISSIKKYGEDSQLFSLESIASKGNKIIPGSSDTLSRIKETSLGDSSENEQAERCRRIINYLLRSTSYIHKIDILSRFFISETTFYADLSSIRKELSHYNLELIHKVNLGYMITGSELNKRYCITQLGLEDTFTASDSIMEIYNVIADVLIKHQYQIDEETIQNITRHVAISIDRLKTGHPISETTDTTMVADHPEYQISKEILERLISKYQIAVEDEYLRTEEYVLAEIILGKSKYTNHQDINNEINAFLHTALQQIYAKFSINFETNEKLKLFLSFHLVPLIYRARSQTQLKNAMTQHVQKEYPLSYDIALYFTMLLQKHFNISVNTDEVTYLSLYFNYGQEMDSTKSRNLKLLILTKYRTSEIVLLQHKIMSWFPNEIEVIDVVNSSSTDFNIEKYDAVVSTDDSVDQYCGAVIKINLFPTDRDKEKLMLALKGFSTVESVTSLFTSSRFHYADIADKDEALSIVCGCATDDAEQNQGIISEIKFREKILTTYFGNMIAIPHPLAPMTSSTILSVLITKKPIRWDELHDAQIIILFLPEKNNPRALQLWHYLSEFVHDSRRIEDIINNPTYDNFIRLLHDSTMEIMQG